MDDTPTPPRFFAHSTDGPVCQWQLLSDHLIQVSELAGTFASHFNASSLAATAGILHDLGKYTIKFQQRVSGAAVRVNHSTWGAKIAIEQYESLGWLLAYGIAGHHTGLANGSGFDGERTALCNRLSDPDLPPLETVWKQEVALPGLKELAVPGSPFIKNPQYKNFHLGFLTRMIFSALVDADYLDTESYYDQFTPKNKQRATHRTSSTPELSRLRDQLDNHLKQFNNKTAINRIRSDILTYARKQSVLKPGIFSLTVPTGGGKTLASLAFALDHAITHGQRRVIFVIPFTSIVEQNAAVFRQALGKHGDAAVLEHHSAFASPEPDKRNPERYQSQEKLKLAMENWDAPIVVTTAVQFFESLFSARPSQCRKLHNISNSVVILDEVQTIPLHVLRPAVAALDELARNYRSSIVLCTATQPALEAPEFKGHLLDVRPLVRDATTLARKLERVKVHHVGKLQDEELTQLLRERDQALCIVNNRLHARALFQTISDLPGSIHLSTLMCAKHRSAALHKVKKLLSAGRPCRVVSTSLIEAGVDVSFPTVLRAEAGLDSIAQAAGRCNRNKERSVDQSEVLVFEVENPEWRPPMELLQFAQVAQEVLRQYRDDPLSPIAIEAYFKKLYWQKGEQALDSKGILKRIAESGIQNLPMETVARDFRMITTQQFPIIIAWDTTAQNAIQSLRYAEKAGGLARKIQPYLVQIPQTGYAALRKIGAIQAIQPDKWGDQFMELVNMEIYSDDFGLWWEEPSFIDSSKLTW